MKKLCTHCEAEAIILLRTPTAREMFLCAEHARVAVNAPGVTPETVAQLNEAIARAEERAAAGIKW